MPTRPCLDCGTLTGRSDSRCPACAHTREQTRGSGAARGYDAEHERQRKRWDPIVRAGRAVCHRPECGQPIQPTEPWVMGHTEDRTGWTGPEHQHCSNASGGRAAHG